MSLVPFICDRPWLITPTGLDMVLALAERHQVTPELVLAYHEHRRLGPQMVAQRNGEAVKGAPSLRIRSGGVGVISLVGPIIRHADFFSEVSDGATSLDSLMRDFDIALGNTDVKSIVLEIDSPGGEAAGIDEAARMIRRIDAQKPVTAVGDFLVASAAMNLAAGASRIVGSPVSFHGSIGAVGEWIDRSGMDEKLGIKRRRYVSTQSPKKGLMPGTDEGDAEIQAQLDYIAGNFQEAMAELRGVAKKRVVDDFGRGGILDARKALDVGMIDDIGHFEGVVRAVADGRKYRVGDAQKFMAAGGPNVTIKEWFIKTFGSAPPDEVLAPHSGVQVIEPGESAATPSASPAPEGRRDHDPENVKLRDEIRDLKIDALVRDLKAEERIDPVEEKDVRGRLVAAWNLDGRHGLSGSDSSYGLLEATLKARPRGMMKEEVSVDKPLSGRRQVGHEDKVTEEDPNFTVLDRVSNHMAGQGKSNGSVK